MSSELLSDNGHDDQAAEPDDPGDNVIEVDFPQALPDVVVSHIGPASFSRPKFEMDKHTWEEVQDVFKRLRGI